ncbi:MAG: family 16 glycosylhydrolase [Bacteroidales bacterium]|nr:family 16 glycosylhydrolase [Bacteroidales bacterium]
MKKIIYLIFIICFSAVGNAQDYQMVWADEFDLDTVNVSNWNFEIGNGNNGWGNNELQYYTSRPENAIIEEGKLVITAIKEVYNGYNYTSARMQTRNKAYWRYGRVEMRAKLPQGAGTWPAFWMMPQNQVYGTSLWPDNGEIDIMEYVGYMPDKVHGTVHTYQNFGSSGVSNSITYYGVENDFHIYAIEWDPDTIRWYVDEYLFGSYRRAGRDWQYWPFDKEFYIILNFAVGGNWGGAEGVDESVFPQRYEIDYVRVYQKEYTDVETRVLQNENIIISSNPVRDNLHLSGLEYLKEYSLSVADIYGKILISRNKLCKSTIDIDLFFLKAGIYFIIIQNLEMIKIIKIIKI